MNLELRTSLKNYSNFAEMIAFSVFFLYNSFMGAQTETQVRKKAIMFSSLLMASSVLVMGWMQIEPVVAARVSAHTDPFALAIAASKNKGVAVPEKDYFNRMIRWNVQTAILILPPCNSCILNAKGDMKVPLPKQNVIVFLQDDVRLNEFKKHSFKELNVWPVLDHKRKLAPNTLYDIAPVFVILDSHQRVVEVKRWL